MGKASRNKRENQELRRLEADKKQKEAAKAKKKSIRNKIIGAVCVLLIIVLVGTVVAYTRMTDGGYFLRNTVSLTSENYEMDNALVSYHFNNQYQNFLSAYGNSLSYFGIDPSKSLKQQPCPLYEDGRTWYSFFMDAAVQEMTNVLIFCEEANARGITLTESDYDVIDDYIESIKEQAKANGVSKEYYITAMFGKGVKEKDVRRAMEQALLYSACHSEIVDGYTYTDAEYDAYVKENPNKLLHATYAIMNLTLTDGMVEGDITLEMLKEFETKFQAVNTKEAFDEVAYDYLKNYAYKNYTDKTDDGIREEIAEKLVEDGIYTETDAFMKWAIEDSRKAGDVYTAWNEEETALTVGILLKPAALLTYDTVNVRHILLTADTYGSDEAAEAKAEEILAQWKAGEATAASFGALAEQYSEDGAENGLYENVMKSEMVDEFNDWIFEEDRKAGDTGIVKTQYGYHVMYLDGFGMTAWQREAKDILSEEAYEKDYEALKEKYPVEVDQVALALLDV
ncbi:MAG: peptidylprolyl isomerase [Clostridia bacterium]|nr:peptidylprolyl isomerase [Clostridia bacterium]